MAPIVPASLLGVGGSCKFVSAELRTDDDEKPIMRDGKPGYSVKVVYDGLNLERPMMKVNLWADLPAIEHGARCRFTGLIVDSFRGSKGERVTYWSATGLEVIGDGLEVTDD